MKRYGRNLHLFSLTIVIVFLNSYVFEDRARGETHFIKSLSLIKLDEKIKAQNFVLESMLLI